jgi:hypothetical protein
MKIKNYFAFVCVIWAMLSISNSILAINNFIQGYIVFGVINIILSVSFAFACGSLFEKAIMVRKYNKQVDLIAKEIKEELEELKNIPFKEFENEQEGL